MDVRFRLLEVHLQNFGLVGRSTVRIPRSGLVFVKGVNRDAAGDSSASNMSGKTTLLNALCYGLYGCDACGDKIPVRLLAGLEDCPTVVELTFSARGLMVGGRPVYRVLVRREKEEGADSPVTVTVKVRGLTGRAQKRFMNYRVVRSGADGAVAAVIEQTFGPRELFLATNVYARGDGFTAFAARTRGEKVGFFDLVIDNNDLDAARERTTLRAEKFRAKEALLEKRMCAATALRDSAQAAFTEASGESRVLADQIREREEQPAAPDGLGALERELDLLRGRVGEARRAADEARDAKEEAGRRHAAAAASLRTREKAAEAAADGFRELLAAASSGGSEASCPTCGSHLDAASVGVMLQAEEEALRAVREEQQACEDRRGEEKRGLDRACREADAAWREVSARYQEAQRRVADLKRKAEDGVVAMRERLRLLIRESVAQRARAAKTGTEIAEIGKKVSTTRDRLADLRFWEEAFTARGVRRLRLDAVVPFMNAAAARYSRILLTGCRVEYSMTRQGAKGDVEDFAVRLVGDDGQDCVMPSAGQRARRDIIHTLVTCEVAGNLGRRRVQCLAFDEVFSSLDEVGRRRVHHVLEAVAEQTQSVILVIEHDSALESMFRTRIVAERSDGDIGYKVEE